MELQSCRLASKTRYSDVVNRAPTPGDYQFPPRTGESLTRASWLAGLNAEFLIGPLVHAALNQFVPSLPESDCRANFGDQDDSANAVFCQPAAFSIASSVSIFIEPFPRITNGFVGGTHAITQLIHRS